jgi:hypothetical protein
MLIAKNLLTREASYELANPWRTAPPLRPSSSFRQGQAALGACSLASFFKSGEVPKTWALQQVGGYLGYTRSDAAQMPICGRSQPD